jgi:hypothetical protein
MKKTITITLIIFATLFMQSFSETVSPKEPVVIAQTDSVSAVQPIVVEKANICKWVKTVFKPSLRKKIAFYDSHFDSLAKKTNLNSLKQDKEMFDKAQYKDETINGKISDLKKYHQSKLSLTQKYNETEITDAISSLKTINRESKEVENLIKPLERIAFYGSDFDSLANTTTFDSLKKDKDILNKAKYQDDTIANKISDLEKYHQSKLPLTHKYNETEIADAILSLKTINRESKEVKNLIILLENYVHARKHLYELVQQLNAMIISIIQKKIENEIYKNDGVNAETYPYLYRICSEILEMNREEINKNCSNLLEKIGD